MTENRPVRVGLLGASFETPNLGVSALAEGALRSVLARFPDASFFFLDYAKHSAARTARIGNRTIPVPLVPMRFSRNLWLSNNIAFLILLAILIRMAPSRRLRRRLIESNPCLREIDAAHYILSVAGGDSFSDIYGVARFLYVALPQLLVLLLRKPLVQLPQTYGPFRGSMVRAVARWIVAHSERAWSRDYRSLRQLMCTEDECLVPEKLAFCYDLAFAIEPHPPAAILVDGLSLPTHRDPSLVGVNISGLLWFADAAGKNPFGLRAGYRQFIAELIDLLISGLNASILLVPHVLGDEESDASAAEQIYASFRSRYPGRLGVLRGSFSPGELRYITSLCGFFVGSRMHACIGAVSEQVPAAAVAYSDKFLGVMETIGIPALTVDARALDTQGLLDAITGLWLQRSALASHLAARMPEIRLSLRHLLDEVDPQSAAHTSAPRSPRPAPASRRVPEQS
jgi:polysaccharide pyruvyl transferase WcaK-like protein